VKRVFEEEFMTLNICNVYLCVRNAAFAQFTFSEAHHSLRTLDRVIYYPGAWPAGAVVPPFDPMQKYELHMAIPLEQQILRRWRNLLAPLLGAGVQQVGVVLHDTLDHRVLEWHAQMVQGDVVLTAVKPGMVHGSASCGALLNPWQIAEERKKLQPA